MFYRGISMDTHAFASGAHAHGESGSLNRIALSTTAHCFTGCAIGEVAGMAIGTALAWDAAGTVFLSITLAFLFGYSLTSLPLLRAGMGIGTEMKLALASDTASITIMEIVDNLIMLIIPGAMMASLSSSLFSGSLALSLAIAFVAAYPVNRYLIARGRGHAVVHAPHQPDAQTCARVSVHWHE
jgi:hypothetical protein